MSAAERLPTRGRGMRRLLGYIGRHKLYYAAGASVTLLYVAAFVSIPPLVGWSVTAVAEDLGESEVMRRVAWLLAVTLVGAAVRFFSRVLLFNAGRRVEYEIRNDIFSHLLRLPQSFYFRWRTGDIMSRCVNDINSVRLLLGVGVLNVVQTPVLYLATIAMMFAYNAKLALLVFVPYPVFILIARTFGRAIHRWSLATQEGLADLSNQLQEAISGIAVVKAYAMEGVMARRFETANGELYRRQIHLAVANAAMPAIVILLPAASMGIVLFVGGRLILGGEMALGDFFTFAMYIYQLTFPTFIMGWVVALVQRGAASMQRIDELLSSEPTIRDADGATAPAALRGEIQFRNLTFRYPGADVDALADIDLHVPPGTTLGIVGPIGSGKSTLASLVPRLYEVEDGRVFIDGIDVNQWALASLRSGIAMVPQESFLFSMSLEENITFGLEGDDPVVARRAAEGAQLAKDVVELPHAYDTVVGERGVMLSGGQRQRTALARALAIGPSILILDDVLSAVDAETEEGIKRELAETGANRTVLMVSHRVSAVRDADQIVVLDEGRIVERGRHFELLAEGGLYARLAQEEVEEDRTLHGLELEEVRV